MEAGFHCHSHYFEGLAPVDHAEERAKTTGSAYSSPAAVLALESLTAGCHIFTARSKATRKEHGMLNGLMCAVLLAAAPRPFVEGPTVEGVTEYALPNGLRVLLIPDQAAATLSVNLTVLVGSREEGAGEKGMAHLLEHLLFKGSTHYRDPRKELGTRGGRWNGNTSEDRTTYFESMPSSDANLEFGLRFEADRLVNSFVEKKDLEMELAVVRNEFEQNENNGGVALRERVRSAALPWHNYGRAVIGVRADLERVPIENLKAFYKRYYQPDNAVLVLVGRFDAEKAFRIIADSFGRIPRPTRTLVETFTSEPAQDGERFVAVRRVGGAPMLSAVWHIPAVSDPDYPALVVLQGVLGDEPQGRLHQALVDTKKAAGASCDQDELKDPGLFTCSVAFKEGDATAPAKDAMLALLENPRPLKDAEVARARDGWLSQYEQELTRAEALGMLLSEWAARGDWRLLYLLRDRLREVKTADVERVWAKYLKPQNRTLGEYVPTAAPDRVELPVGGELKAVLASYKGGAAVAQGESFDPSPANLDARTRRSALPNGAKLLLLPKKTRAATVNVAMALRLGTAQRLQGQQALAQVTADLLGRGTQKLDYRDFRSALERLKSNIFISGTGQEVQVIVTTERPQLAEVLGLLSDALKAPALDGPELEELKSDLLARLDTVKSEPQVLGSVELARALSQLPPEHIDAVLPLPEQLAAIKAVTLEQVKDFYGRFYGTQSASIAVVGDFDPAEVEKTLSASFGGWTAKESYEPALHPFFATRPEVKVLPTPDRINAWMGAGSTAQLLDSSPDYPALLLAVSVLGGGPSGRLWASLREKQGLSYGAFARLQADAQNDTAVLLSSALYAPQNAALVEKALKGELARWPTITREELEPVRAEVLQTRYQARANDDELVVQLAQLAADGRAMDWEAKLDDALRAVTPEQVNAAVKKYVDPSMLVLVKAGDFKAVRAPK
jgi:zinc protease